MERSARKLRKLLNIGRTKHATQDGRTILFKTHVTRSCQKLEVLTKKALSFEELKKKRGDTHEETAEHRLADGPYKSDCLISKGHTMKQPTTFDKASSQPNHTSFPTIYNVGDPTSSTTLPTIHVTPPVDEAAINEDGCHDNRVEDAQCCLTAKATLESSFSTLKTTSVVHIVQDESSKHCINNPTTNALPTDFIPSCVARDRSSELQRQEAGTPHIHSVSLSENDAAIDRLAGQVETAVEDGDDGHTSESPPVEEELFDEVTTDSSDTSVDGTELLRNPD